MSEVTSNPATAKETTEKTPRIQVNELSVETPQELSDDEAKRIQGGGFHMTPLERADGPSALDRAGFTISS